MMKRLSMPSRAFARMTAAAGAFLAAAAFSAPAGAIVYTVDRMVGDSGHVSGTIETDGTLGTLQSLNILDWSLTLTVEDTSVDLLGPLSGDNSVFGAGGEIFDATATELSFDVTGAVKGFQFCLEAPAAPGVCNLGLSNWIVSGTATYYEAVRSVGGKPIQADGPMGGVGDVYVLATVDAGPPVSDVPLPAGAWLFLTGAAGALGLRRKRKSKN